MAKRQRVLAAGVVKDILFENIEALDGYLNKLEEHGTEHYVLETLEREDLTVIARIVSEWNYGELIKI